ncbi:cell division protein FtsB [Salinisphaera sp. Q1T1-3]|uniref:cell division protein FtsB n=1 Tax=Salinisphaera sp. Q1T1-3 TaxID=2321229 RepID=UPI000E71CB0D|nr:cell division protein FtsB [Salinisphaera sp. Q1T1-3]RJS95323.1 cell division protein FtsB [Salinisphaera sp. Q1T1-3]
MYRVVIVVLLLVFAALQYRLWVGDGSVAEISRIDTQRDALHEANAKAEARNDAMQKEVDDLKAGEGASEGRARSEMGMVKPGETFFLTVPDGQDASDGDADRSDANDQP